MILIPGTILPGAMDRRVLFIVIPGFLLLLLLLLFGFTFDFLSLPEHPG